MKPQISVVIPTLNEEKFIGKCLDSLNEQDFKNFEVIVSDSYSSDRTVQIAKQYGAKIVLTRKMGPAAGRNEGAKKALADIIVFLDGDNRIQRNLLSKISNLMIDRKIIGGVCSLRPDSKNYFDTAMFKLGNLLIVLLIKLDFPFLLAPAFCAFYRKDIFKKGNGFREDLVYLEDNDLAMRARRHGKFSYLNASVIVSMRRFKKLGCLKTLISYLIPTFHYILNRQVPSTKFKYQPVR